VRAKRDEKDKSKGDGIAISRSVKLVKELEMGKV